MCKVQTSDYMFYNSYEYEQDVPLAFVSLTHPSAKLNDSQVLELLRRFDVLYGSTDQDTTDWALEYQVLARNLIHDGALILNPRYLDLPECLEEIMDILTPLQAMLYREALSTSEEDLLQLSEEMG